MKKRIAKHLKAAAEAIGFNKSPQERKKIYKRFKSIYKDKKNAAKKTNGIIATNKK